MKKLFLMIFPFLWAVSFSFAASDSITLTTYYPAPFGSYDTLRLVPKASGQDYSTPPPCQTGSLYVNSSNELKFCDGTGAWVGFGGSSMWTRAPSSGPSQVYLTYFDDLVGIGTSSPENRLTIKQLSNNAPLKLEQSNAQDGWKLNANYTTGNLDFIRDAAEGDRPATLSLTMGSAGISGNVGIGTASPGKKLHVANIIADTQLFLSSVSPSIHLANNDIPASATMNAILAQATLAGHYGLGVGDVLLGAYGNSRGNIYINSNYSGSGTKNVILQPSTGNVGIGNTNPTTKLQVTGDIYATGKTFVLNNACPDTSYVNWAPFTASDSNDTVGIYSVATNVMAIDARRDCSSAIAHLDLQPSGGNVGIGTANPGYKLDVAGATNATQLCINGNCQSSWPGSKYVCYSVNAMSYSPAYAGVFDSVPGNTWNGQPCAVVATNSWSQVFVTSDRGGFGQACWCWKQ